MGCYGDYRNCSCGLLHCSRNRTAGCNDHIDIEPNKVGCHLWNEFSFTGRQSPINFQVPPFDISECAEPIEHSIDPRNAVA
jgi:hypothetical protein